MINKKHCIGCRSDFYNGNNNRGIKECWNLKKAKLVSRIAIGHWEPPPYKNKKKKKVPDCWHGEGSNRIHYIDPNTELTGGGYWR